MIKRRLARLGFLVGLIWGLAPARVLAAGPQIMVDNTAGNGIATGEVSRADPADALLTVRNNYHFWVAVEVQAVVGAEVMPAVLSDDLHGLFAGGGLIPPSGSAAWHAVIDSSTGGQVTIRVHYDFSSAGGAVAVAGNILTIVADSLGVSLSASSPSTAEKAFKLLMEVPEYVDLVDTLRGPNPPNMWEFVKSMKTLLGSKTGRAAILEGLRELGVSVSEGRLVEVASVVGIIDWWWTLQDLMTASILGRTDGTVTFWLRSTPQVPTPAGSKVTGSLKWRVAEAPPYPWVPSRAELLDDGRVALLEASDSFQGCVDMIIPGEAESFEGEIYDPIRGTWRKLPDSGSVGEIGGVVALPDGRLMVVGANRGAEGNSHLGAELYNAKTDEWSSLPSPDVLVAYALVGLPDGRVAMVGGVESATGSGEVESVFDPETESWSQLVSLSPFFRANVVGLADGTLLVVDAYQDSSAILDPSTGLSRQISLPTGASSIGTMRTLPDGRVVAVGYAPEQDSIVVYIYAPAVSTWSVAYTHRVPGSFSGIVMRDGRVIVAGGAAAAGSCENGDYQTTPLSAVTAFDLATGQATSLDPLPAPAYSPSLVELADGRLMAVWEGGAAVLGP